MAQELPVYMEMLLLLMKALSLNIMHLDFSLWLGILIFFSCFHIHDCIMIHVIQTFVQGMTVQEWCENTVVPNMTGNAF